MKRYKSILEKNWKISKPLMYKEMCEQQNLYWDTYKEYQDKEYHISFYKPSHAMSYFISESVIRPDKYIVLLCDNLKSIIQSNQGKKFAVSELFCKFINSKLKIFNIEFRSSNTFDNEESKLSGVNVMFTGYKSLTIIIFCSPIINELFINKELSTHFLQVFKEIVGHELIHRSQFINRHLNKSESNIMRQPPEEFNKYLSQKTEIMSYAWQIIEELRFKGLSDTKILNYIKTKRNDNNLDYENNILDYYIYTFRDTQVLNQLFKYMYEYLKGDFNLNEVDFY